MKRLLLAIVVAVLLRPSPASATGPNGMETWCVDNPTICVCHFDMAGTAWSWEGAGYLGGLAWGMTPIGGGAQGTSDKWCGYSPGFASAPPSGNPALYVNAAGPTIIAGPNGHNATRFTFTVRSETSTGIFQQAAVLGTDRFGGRYYFRLGAGYESTGGACTNDKYSQIGGPSAPDYWTAFAATGFQWAGGEHATPNWTPASTIGHWIRMEMYVTSGQIGRTYDVYMTDLTTGVTSSVTGLAERFPFEPISYTVYNASFIEPLHRYRENTCNGTWDGAYLVMAHWPTNLGQRIPAAVEMEGGGGPVPPAAPTNLRFGALIPLFALLWALGRRIVV